MRNNVTVPSSSFQFSVSHHTGVGYLHSKMNRSRTTTGPGNIVARLTSRSITGHTLHIQMHQHYRFDFHLVLRDDSCILRICESATLARRVCSQLEMGLVGLCSCVFDDRRELPLPENVEPCLRALPLLDWFRSPCHCELCKPDGRLVGMLRWLRKFRLGFIHSKGDLLLWKYPFGDVGMIVHTRLQTIL